MEDYELKIMMMA